MSLEAERAELGHLHARHLLWSVVLNVRRLQLLRRRHLRHVARAAVLLLSTGLCRRHPKRTAQGIARIGAKRLPLLRLRKAHGRYSAAQEAAVVSSLCWGILWLRRSHGAKGRRLGLLCGRRIERLSVGPVPFEVTPVRVLPIATCRDVPLVQC